MMDYSAGLPGLGRRSVERLLEALNVLRLKNGGLDSTARPLLALHLRGGVTAEGWLLDFGPAESGADKEPMVVLHRAYPSAQQPAEAVFYVALREIQSITIFEAVDAAHHLLPPLSKMDLRRVAEQVAQDASTRSGKTVSAQLAIEGIPETSFQLVADQLAVLKGVLAQLLSDTAGRDAFKEKVSALSIEPGKASAAILKGGTLALTVVLQGKGISSGDLKQQLEAAL